MKKKEGRKERRKGVIEKKRRRMENEREGGKEEWDGVRKGEGKKGSSKWKEGEKGGKIKK